MRIIRDFLTQLYKYIHLNAGVSANIEDVETE